MAVRSAMGIAALAGVMATGGAYAQDEAAEVEEVVVTGSRIKRTTNTESQTVITITAADMKLTGEVTVADALCFIRNTIPRTRVVGCNGVSCGTKNIVAMGP